MMFTLH